MKWIIVLFELISVSTSFRVHPLAPGYGPAATHRRLVALETGYTSVPGCVYGSASQICLPLVYWGGPVINTPTVYILWYGDWTDTNKTFINNYLLNLNGSSHMKLLSYFPGSSITGNLILKPSKTQTSYLTAVTKAQLLANIESAWPTVDPSGIYIALTAYNVDVSISAAEKFCVDHCGWHDSSPQGRRYAWVGDASSLCPQACAVRSASPNGLRGADALISIMTHELYESTTDPEMSGYTSRSSGEVGDICAFGYGQTYSVNGANANVRMGGVDYLIQQIVDFQSAGQVCALEHGEQGGESCSSALTIPVGSVPIKRPAQYNVWAKLATSAPMNMSLCVAQGDVGFDVYYKLVLSEWPATCTVTTCGTSFDTVLAVYTSCAASTFAACNDDFCSRSAGVTFTADQSTYYVAVGGKFQNVGQFTLNIACTPPDSKAPTPPTTAAPSPSSAPTTAPSTALPTAAPSTATPTQKPSKPTRNPTDAPSLRPTAPIPATQRPSTGSPSTTAPTVSPSTRSPSSFSPTTISPSTYSPTTLAPSTLAPSTLAPSTLAPSTRAPSASPSTLSPTTSSPSTLSPTTRAPSSAPTSLTPTRAPSTTSPSRAGSTPFPSRSPSTSSPSTPSPTTSSPATQSPSSLTPTLAPSRTTVSPSTFSPSSKSPTLRPSTKPPPTRAPIAAPSKPTPRTRPPTRAPTPRVIVQKTRAPTTSRPTTTFPTSRPTTSFPTPQPYVSIIGFSDLFVPDAWDSTPTTTTLVDFESSSLKIQSTDAGASNRVMATTRMDYPTRVRFRWAYVAKALALFDQPRFSVNGVEKVMPGFSALGLRGVQSGTFDLQLKAGDALSLIAWTLDGSGGGCTMTITEFTADVDRRPVPCVTRGFSGSYFPDSWRITKNWPKANAQVRTFDVDTLEMSSNTVDHPNVSLLVTHAVTVASVVSFRWVYSTSDRVSFDQPRIVLNGLEQVLSGFDTAGSQRQAGTFSVSIPAGGSFGVGVWSADGRLTPCSLTITKFVVTESPCGF